MATNSGASLSLLAYFCPIQIKLVWWCYQISLLLDFLFYWKKEKTWALEHFFPEWGFHCSTRCHYLPATFAFLLIIIKNVKNYKNNLTFILLKILPKVAVSNKMNNETKKWVFEIVDIVIIRYLVTETTKFKSST